MRIMVTPGTRGGNGSLPARYGAGVKEGFRITVRLAVASAGQVFAQNWGRMRRQSITQGGIAMRYAAFLSVALLSGAAVVAPAHAQQGLDLVKAGVAAQGGVDALRALKTVVIQSQS